jgi:uncharacterized protein (TIGR02270 family)
MLNYIPDLVEEHYDELQFLWSRRRLALASPSYTEQQLSELEERIAGHADGLLALGDRLVEFVESALNGEEELPAFAAAFALVRRGDPDNLRRVLDALERAAGNKLRGLRDALAHPAAAPIAPQLTSLFLEASPPVGAAAGEALAFQGAIAPAARQLERFIRAEQPTTRASGWRLTAYCGVSVPAEWYDAGLNDDDREVKHAALVAAAWNRSPAFPSYCRALATTPAPEAVEPLTLYAAVALPEEYQVIGSIAAADEAGPSRFRVVGAFAHPYFVDLLIKEMENPNPVAAASAGTAFYKMTGRNVESDRRVKVPADGKPPTDDFEVEFQDDIFLPDPELAREHWHELAPRLARSSRICRGMDVSQPLSREQFGTLDMESRWEYCLRMRLFSGWQGTPLVLERYPQRF